MRKMRLTALLLFSLLLILTGCSAGSNSKGKDDFISRDGFALDTTINIKLYGTDNEALLTECMEMLDSYDSLLSRTKESSEIYQLNANGEGDLSEETLELLKAGLYYSELSGGAFDISIAPVTSLWDFKAEVPVLPDADALEEATKHVDYTKIKIEGNHVTLEEGMAVDLGAIAKGYIADRVKDYLVGEGVTSGIINLGGNVLCIGKKPSGDNFGIGIRDPEDASEICVAVSVEDKSVVTSGTYERYIVVDGVKYHHILNPKTGYSYENGLASVSIISDQSVDGDGLSTTCFALGKEKALELIDSLDQVWAMFVEEDGTITYSDGFKKNMQIREY